MKIIIVKDSNRNSRIAYAMTIDAIKKLIKKFNIDYIVERNPCYYETGYRLSPPFFTPEIREIEKDFDLQLTYYNDKYIYIVTGIRSFNQFRSIFKLRSQIDTRPIPSYQKIDIYSIEIQLKNNILTLPASWGAWNSAMYSKIPKYEINDVGYGYVKS